MFFPHAVFKLPISVIITVLKGKLYFTQTSYFLPILVCFGKVYASEVRFGAKMDSVHHRAQNCMKTVQTHGITGSLGKLTEQFV